MTTNLNNQTITCKSVNPRVAGIGLHNKLRRSFNSFLHGTKFVIRRVDITYNKQTKQFDYDSYFSIVDDSPLIREFGLSDEHKTNFKAFDIDGDDNKKKARRINIDGQSYVLSYNIMAIQCDNKRMIDKLADEGYEVDGHKYMAVTASPSNEKHSVKYYAMLNDEVPNEDAIFWKLDKLMGGCLSDKLMKDPETGLPILVDGKLVTKVNTRIGNYASGMKPMGTIDLTKERVALVRGSMNQACDFDEETKKQMKKMGINIDENINDGAGYLAASKVVEMFGDTLGIKLTEDQATRVAIQTRWTVFTTKIMARTVKTSILEVLADFYNAEIYGNPDGELVALVDEDGAKMINFSALRNRNVAITLYVMAIANASGVRSCSQHAIKYMAVDEQKTKELFNKLATMAVDDFVANKLENDEANTNLVNSRIMANLSPDEVCADAFLMEALLSDTWTYCKSMIAENKVTLDGVYTHMMFDLTYPLVRGKVDSTLRITKEGFVEAYNPDVLRIYAEDIASIENDPELTEEEKDAKLFELLSGVVVKFPSAMPREFEIVVYLTKRQITSRIASLELTNEEKLTVLEYFNASPFGCTVYAPVNAMKNKLAGADCDFDATMTDMSELKFILINKRLEDQEKQPGFMGDCTFISYKDIVRNHLATNEDVFTDCDDIDL
jgi:hypothetical protein